METPFDIYNSSDIVVDGCSPQPLKTKEGDPVGYRIENALYGAPEVVVRCLDGCGMVIDRNSGELLPAEQVIHDPLRRDRVLEELETSPVGWPSEGSNQFATGNETDDEPVTEVETTDPARELSQLIDEQRADLACGCQCQPSRRRPKT